MDLYLRVDEAAPTLMRPFAQDKKLPPIVPVPDKFEEWVSSLRRKIAAQTQNDFSMIFDGIRYRVSCETTALGERWASLRKIPGAVPRMSDLRIPHHVQKKLKFYAKNSGLIVLTGPTGSGKSTTATALLGHYLQSNGDVCVSIEDPVEYDLQSQNWGKHGRCYQFEVYQQHEWAEYLKMALRWHPRYIYLGELRTPEATAQALRAATSGHLVITTLHAGTLQDALHAMRQLAAPIAGDRADHLIADSFLAAVNQELTPFGPKMQMLYAEGKGLGDPVRANLRRGKIEQMETWIDRQNRLH
ncbi:ATPase, T2SS/T4P/T4SS family [Salipiger mucosus]|nr:ATPase, T2SS/T4P/T4SS family [Salipiger mucosus]